MIGGSVVFDENTAELSDDQVEKLQFVCQQFLGKAQKIEIRGHTTRRPLRFSTTLAMTASVPSSAAWAPEIQSPPFLRYLPHNPTE